MADSLDVGISAKLPFKVEFLMVHDWEMLKWQKNEKYIKFLFEFKNLADWWDAKQCFEQSLI